MDSVMEVQDATPDSAWIKDTLNGNQNAFGCLVKRYQDRFLAMACRILGNNAEAEDAVQDAFLQAYRHLSDFQNKALFSTWLYSIVLNQIRSRLRHNRILRWTSLDGSPDTDEYKPLQIAEKSPSSDVLLEQKLRLEEIQKVVSSFPPPVPVRLRTALLSESPSQRRGGPIESASGNSQIMSSSRSKTAV